MRVRPATLQDAEAIREIYNYEVLHTTATFDLIARTLEDQQDWLATRSGAFSALVAQDDHSNVTGFTSLSPYKDRAGYRTSVEDSIYVSRAAQGQGIGRLLLTAVLDVAQAHGFHAVLARIEASGVASRGLHAACGFQLVGIEREVGRKFGRWRDVAVMQCLLHERTAAQRTVVARAVRDVGPTVD